MLFDLQNPIKKPIKKPRTTAQEFCGTIDAVEFIASVFHIELKDGKWRLFGSKLDENNVIHKLQMVFPDTYTKGVYKLDEHKDIVLTYSTTDELEPILKYGAFGLIDFTEIDPGNTRVTGALKDVETKHDGDPVSIIKAKFTLG